MAGLLASDCASPLPGFGAARPPGVRWLDTAFPEQGADDQAHLEGGSLRSHEPTMRAIHPKKKGPCEPCSGLTAGRDDENRCRATRAPQGCVHRVGGAASGPRTT